MINVSRVIAEFSRKSAPHAELNDAREAKKIRRRQILTEPDWRARVNRHSCSDAPAGNGASAEITSR